MQRAGAGSEQRVGDVVGVVVVGVPAADQQVDVGGVLPRVEVGGHVAGVANDFDAKVGPHAEQGRQQRLCPIAQQRLHGGAHPDRTRETRGFEQPNGVLTGERGPAPACVVAEHARRDQSPRPAAAKRPSVRQTRSRGMHDSGKRTARGQRPGRGPAAQLKSTK